MFEKIFFFLIHFVLPFTSKHLSERWRAKTGTYLATYTNEYRSEIESLNNEKKMLFLLAIRSKNKE